MSDERTEDQSDATDNILSASSAGVSAPVHNKQRGHPTITFPNRGK